MTIIKILATGILVLFCSGAFGQVSKDSVTILKQQKESLAISARINDRKIQLAKLENTISKKSEDVEKAKAEAQLAADENAKAANDLTGDPQNKSLARKAGKAAKYAQRSAKNARSADDDLSDLRKDIESLKSKIADDQSKLAGMPAVIPQQQ
ncbi:MAG: hypothetical protein ABJB86_20130 [Bacteroidota bacterium]